jgi:uncharacterized protein (TIGR02246 family)
MWTIAAGLAGAAPVSAADSWETEIRAAEQRHIQAFLAADVPAMQALFSDQLVVNSPLNTVIGKEQLLGMVRSGILNASEFTQEIDRIQRIGDDVFVMGTDRAVFAAPSPNAGKTHKRRFTDVWRLEGGRWIFIARQATLLCP